MDFKKAMMNPAKLFGSPQKVCEEVSLTREQKIKILRQWEYDAREIEVASEESMTGGSPSLLAEVLKALLQLGVEVDSEGSSPTKQGGL